MNNWKILIEGYSIFIIFLERICKSLQSILKGLNMHSPEWKFGKRLSTQITIILKGLNNNSPEWKFGERAMMKPPTLKGLNKKNDCSTLSGLVRRSPVPTPAFHTGLLLFNPFRILDTKALIASFLNAKFINLYNAISSWKRDRKMLSFTLMFITFTLSIQAQTKFTNITEAAGIDHEFAVKDGFLGGGVCVLDVNNDGFQDLFITGGKQPDRFYLNQKDGTFKDILGSAGIGKITKEFVTQGVASADVNRDGFVDLFITTNTTMDSTQVIPRAINLFFLNNGDNTFRDATTEFGLDQMNSFSTGVSFGDFNADGYPDVYVGNYFHDYTGPLDEISDATMVNSNNTAQGYLLLNQKGKRFKNVYADYGMKHKGFGFGGLFTDFDNDGDQDLYVLHDFGYKAKPNYLLENQYPKKTFKYIEKEMEMDLRINAMASAVGDYDNNGWLDYFVTDIRFNHFMVSGGGKGKPFSNKSKALGTQLFKIGWGANFADFDHDGDLDLFVANGDLNPNCTPMDNFYYENVDNHFEQIAYKVGLNDYGLGRGSVVFDLENDGDLDLLVVNQQPVLYYPIPSRTLLYRNDSIQGNWLKVKLKGINAESNGLGSRVKVVNGTTRMIREIDGGGSSHLSQNSTIAHFGVGTATTVDSIIVTWIGGKEQILTNQATNQLLVIEEIPDEETPFLWFIYGGIFILGLILLARKFIRKKAT